METGSVNIRKVQKLGWSVKFFSKREPHAGGKTSRSTPPEKRFFGTWVAHKQFAKVIKSPDFSGRADAYMGKSKGRRPQLGTQTGSKTQGRLTQDQRGDMGSSPLGNRVFSIKSRGGKKTTNYRTVSGDNAETNY